MRGERVLVTGGSGFIGSNLAEALGESGMPVVFPVHKCQEDTD